MGGLIDKYPVYRPGIERGPIRYEVTALPSCHCERHKFTARLTRDIFLLSIILDIYEAHKKPVSTPVRENGRDR